MLRELRIGDMVAKLPIIQGGMGVGVSLSRLAGAVAKEGGVGVISTAQIGFEEPEFEKDQAKANLIAIKKHIKKAKELACGHGMVGVNIMVALKHYKEHVLAAVEAGADVIISGAGLPMELPELVDEKSHTRIAPIVSSKRHTDTTAQRTLLLSRDQRPEDIWDFPMNSLQIWSIWIMTARLRRLSAVQRHMRRSLKSTFR